MKKNTEEQINSKESTTELPKDGLYTEECLKEIQLSEDDVKKLKTKDISNASDKTQCYFNCCLQKDEIIFDGAPNDDIIYDRLRNITGLNEEESMKILNICKVIEGDDMCNVSYRLVKCFIEHKANIIVWRVANVI
ncbi:general odorant-binding protein 56a-like isoform X2 [Condylostylus longicornis]|uniref:general odorant-binding protein 56a-like isoform X2 n=1 Tax=Condylostylus longicornis TaxID=2530218 RepID=UPI00244D9D8E|nr:general odorant-binding protein 56a-like isoform X2 [Condylostylus longicornis]